MAHKGSLEATLFATALQGELKKKDVFLFDKQDIFGIKKKEHPGSALVWSTDLSIYLSMYLYIYSFSLPVRTA